MGKLAPNDPFQPKCVHPTAVSRMTCPAIAMRLRRLPTSENRACEHAAPETQNAPCRISRRAHRYRTHKLQQDLRVSPPPCAKRTKNNPGGPAMSEANGGPARTHAPI